MELTYVEATLTGRTGKQVAVRFLADSGVMDTLAPANAWRLLPPKPKRTVAFSLGVGPQVSRSVSECYIALPQGNGRTRRRSSANPATRPFSAR